MERWLYPGDVGTVVYAEMDDVDTWPGFCGSVHAVKIVQHIPNQEKSRCKILSFEDSHAVWDWSQLHSRSHHQYALPWDPMPYSGGYPVWYNLVCVKMTGLVRDEGFEHAWLDCTVNCHSSPGKVLVQARNGSTMRDVWFPLQQYRDRIRYQCSFRYGSDAQVQPGDWVQARYFGENCESWRECRCMEYVGEDQIRVRWRGEYTRHHPRECIVDLCGVRK